MPPRSSQKRPCLRELGRALGEPGEPERRIRLERRVQVRLAAVVDRPQPVRALPREQLRHHAGGRLVVAEPQELEEEAGAAPSWSRSTRARRPTSRRAPGARGAVRSLCRSRDRARGAVPRSTRVPAPTPPRSSCFAFVTLSRHFGTDTRTGQRYADSGWWNGVAPAPLAHERAPAPEGTVETRRAAVRPLRIAPSIVAGQPGSRPGAGAGHVWPVRGRARPDEDAGPAARRTSPRARG